MIRVNEDYIIDVDSYNYTLKRDVHKTTKIKLDGEETERPIYVTIGYFGSLDKALERLLAENIKEKLNDGVYSLKEAVKIVKKCREEWETLVKEIVDEP